MNKQETVEYSLHDAGESIQYRLKRDILHTDIRAPEMATLRGWEEEQQIHLSYMQEAGS